MVGTGIGGQIQAAAKGTSLWIVSCKDHRADPGLNEGPGAHRTGLEGHQQGAVVEAPVVASAGRLAKGDQFGVAQGILRAVAAVAAPAKGAAGAIKQHGSHRDLAFLASPGRAAQQPVHPELVGLRAVHASLVAVRPLGTRQNDDQRVVQPPRLCTPLLLP